uniref:Uncharacterized protein n=1 Tax=Lotharella oceanica TaxID=641309 RepID=A0A7S2TYP8_9EUKA
MTDILGPIGAIRNVLELRYVDTQDLEDSMDPYRRLLWYTNCTYPQGQKDALLFKSVFVETDAWFYEFRLVLHADGFNRHAATEPVFWRRNQDFLRAWTWDQWQDSEQQLRVAAHWGTWE